MWTLSLFVAAATEVLTACFFVGSWVYNTVIETIEKNLSQLDFEKKTSFFYSTIWIIVKLFT